MDTKKTNYSPEFKALIEDPQKAKALIEGSFVRNADFKAWEDGRRFIVGAVDHDGAFLDIGCANGFLARSLQEWSDHQITPYGIDIDGPSIEVAKQLFPNQAGNFFEGNSDDLSRYKQPQPFDFVYWNIPDNYRVNERSQATLQGYMENTVTPGGRMILGFYDTDPNARAGKIKKIEEMGFQIGGRIKNPTGEQELIWIDKPKKA